MNAAKELSSLHPQQLVILLSVYDAHNISRITNRLPEEERQAAVESMVMEAMARHRDPAMGSMRTIFSLLRRIQGLRHQIMETEDALNNLHWPFNHVDDMDEQKIQNDEDHDDS